VKKHYLILISLLTPVIFLLSGCFVTSKQSKIKNDPLSIKKLDYSNRFLKEIPEEVFKCKNLETLVLFRNSLETLPKEIG